jgi:hypothetical protein
MLGHSIVSQHFMEPEGSIPNSQELSTCSYPEPDQSIPHHPIPPLQDQSQYYPPTYVLVFLPPYGFRNSILKIFLQPPSYLSSFPFHILQLYSTADKRVPFAIACCLVTQYGPTFFRPHKKYLYQWCSKFCSWNPRNSMPVGQYVCHPSDNLTALSTVNWNTVSLKLSSNSSVLTGIFWDGIWNSSRPCSCSSYAAHSAHTC